MEERSISTIMHIMFFINIEINHKANVMTYEFHEHLRVFSVTGNSFAITH